MARAGRAVGGGVWGGGADRTAKLIESCEEQTMRRSLEARPTRLAGVAPVYSRLPSSPLPPQFHTRLLRASVPESLSLHSADRFNIQQAAYTLHIRFLLSTIHCTIALASRELSEKQELCPAATSSSTYS